MRQLVLGGSIHADDNLVPYAVYTRNAGDASITFVSNVTGGATSFWGLVPIGVPEPSTCAMLLTGLAGVDFAARRRARKAARTA